MDPFDGILGKGRHPPKVLLSMDNVYKVGGFQVSVSSKICLRNAQCAVHCPQSSCFSCQDTYVLPAPGGHLLLVTWRVLPKSPALLVCLPHSAALLVQVSCSAGWSDYPSLLLCWSAYPSLLVCLPKFPALLAGLLTQVSCSAGLLAQVCWSAYPSLLLCLPPTCVSR